MGCLKLHNYTTLQIAHTSNTARSREGKSDAGLYKYRFNNKEFQDELGLNVYDYGARMYDPAKGRWDVTDGKSELYFSSSPYVYASNTPVQAVDPDGNLVIFINGMHTGDGGKADYWRTYETVRYMTGTKSFMGFSYHTYSTYRRETAAFDRSVMNQLGDQRAMYKDGATGGALGIMTSYGMIGSNTSAQNRIDAGYANGKKDAKVIIENLARDKTSGEIIETIKIITHSMGGAYGKGYVKALQEYIKTLPKDQQKQIKITLVADFDPYQAGSLKANKSVFTEQFSHIGGLADERQEGLNDSNYHEDSTQSAHSIMTYFNDINSLQEGTYKWNGTSWECTTCKK